MSDKTDWFDVSRRGLGKIIERRGKIWLLHELIANAWDADGVTTVEVLLEPEEGRPLVTVVVRDDSPDGFADISHSWTLFAESSRKGQAGKRGRFNLGDKLVLALCDEASIISTKSAVMFDGRGRTASRSRREKGTEFQGIARITRAELAEIRQGLARLIPPPNIATTIDGKRLPTRDPIKTIEAALPTEVADEEGVLRRVVRKCTLHVHEVLPGETGAIYELGIPVMETGDKYHVSIQQKVPLSLERDAVPPAYLRDVRTLVVNALHDKLTEDDANSPLVNEALSDDRAAPEAVNSALTAKYGEKRAIWDPSDPEANMNLVSQGYSLIKGGQLTKAQWDNVKKHEAALPAGRIAPTKKALFGPDGKDTWVPREKWSPAMHEVVEYAIAVCRDLLDRDVHVGVLSDITESWGACFGNQGLVFNLGRLGHSFFDACAAGPTEQLNALLVHELGHGMPGGSNHLDEAYHEGLCKLGARLARLALKRPELFSW